MHDFTTPMAMARVMAMLRLLLWSLAIAGAHAAVPPPLAQRALQLKTGDLVQGRVVADASALPDALDLLDGQGRHLRRLLDSRSLVRGSFAFTAQHSGRYQLVLRGEGQAKPAGPGWLELAQVLPRAAQQSLSNVPASPLLADWLRRPLAARRHSDDFWQAVQRRGGTPLVEAADRHSALVTFLWRGTPATRNVRLFGAPSGDHDPLLRLPGSDIWYRSYRLPLSTRLSYRLAPDVPELPLPAADPRQRRMILATAQRDSRNRRTWNEPDNNAAEAGLLDAWQGSSILELPEAPPQPWVSQRPAVPRGSLDRHRLSSAILGNAREVLLYRPAAEAGPASHLLLVFDAQSYVHRIPTPVILDNLMADGLLPPTAAVILGNGPGDARGRELPPNEDFARFLSEELMPWVRAHGIAAPAAQTVVAGSSYGGLAAAWAGLRAPQWFGNVLAQSGSFWWAPGVRHGREEAIATLADDHSMPGWLTRRYVGAERLPLRFYLEAGLFESDGRGTDILSSSRQLRDVLVARGYPVAYAEHASGHDDYHWRGSLACGLVLLIGLAPPPAKACPMEPVPEVQR